MDVGVGISMDGGVVVDLGSGRSGGTDGGGRVVAELNRIETPRD